ncbi:glycosyltransferase family 2 protein, partial [Patescibacteria group bacterium]|nr:glycosyltransferase family 2 protein [Patescibacteria group bacterium]
VNKKIMSKVVVSIISWNHAKYLADVLNSVLAQTYPDISIVVVDNGSTDGSSDLVREKFPEVGLLRNTNNLGFSRAHNQVIAYTRANFTQLNDLEDLFVLVLNPDIILQTDFIAKLMDRAAHRTDIGSAGGKLLRLFQTMDGDLLEKEFSDVVDSTGIRMFKSRRAVDRNSGQRDNGRFERVEEVFGITGAAVLYRLSALVDVAPDGNYFDEDFFAYKEDIDLAWRLRLRGWKALYIPDAIGYHHRHLAGSEKVSILALLRGRKNRSRFLSRLSYRNHLLMLLKNEQLLNVLIDFPRIWFQETRKALYLIFFEPTTWFSAMLDVIRYLPRTLKKRRAIMALARSRAREIRRWFA